MVGSLVVLGPQRPEPNLPAVLESIPGEGPVVLISAGWRFDEGDSGALRRAIAQPVVHLPLYGWYEEIDRDHPELSRLASARQSRVRRLKELYRQRLQHLVAALEDLEPLIADDPGIAGAEFSDALGAIQSLDDRFLERSHDLLSGHTIAAPHLDHAVVEERHAEAVATLTGARAILVAGGHVGVLRNRMAYFGLGPALKQAWKGGTSIVAWSAGAMALSERVVLFYDDPPDGPSYPELFDRGLGLMRDAVFLPHAGERLRLSDRRRVAVLANRFGPAPCVGLENGAWLERVDGRWINRGTEEGSVRVLSRDGRLRNVEAGHAVGA